MISSCEFCSDGSCTHHWEHLIPFQLCLLQKTINKGKKALVSLKHGVLFLFPVKGVIKTIDCFDPIRRQNIIALVFCPFKLNNVVRSIDYIIDREQVSFDVHEINTIILKFCKLQNVFIHECWLDCPTQLKTHKIQTSAEVCIIPVDQCI